MINLNIVVTNKCNLSCSYCFYKTGYKKNEKKGYLDLEKLLEFLNEFIKYDTIGSISITGGEPMLLQNIKELSRNMLKYSKNISILTNATLIDDDDIDFFINHNIHLQISMDSLNEEYHNEIRGYHHKSFSVINKFIDYGYSNISINFTATPLNYKLYKEIELFTKNNKLGLNLGIVNTKKRLLNWNNASYNSKIELLKIYSKSGLSYKNKLLRYLLFSNQYKEISCPNLKNNFTINPNGSIFRCFSEYLVGNIYYDSIKDVIKMMKSDKECKCLPKISCFDNI